MKILFKRFILFQVIGCMFPLIAEEIVSQKLLKKAQKEAKQLAENHQENIFDDFKNFGFTTDDFLGEEQKGYQFDIQSANQQVKKAHAHLQKSEIHTFIQEAQKSELIEQEEEFLSLSEQVVSDPTISLGIAEIEFKKEDEEVKLEVCTERGSYQAVIEQTRLVTIVPEIKTQIQRCLGHKEDKSYFWEKDAKEKKSKLKKELSKNKSLDSYEVHITKGGLTSDYKVEWFYKHKDNTPICKHFKKEEKIEQKGEEKDQWKASNPVYLEELINDPNCSLMYTSIVEGPETRIIQGKAVYRDKWSQKLLFSCESRADSACDKLRKLGGIIVSRKCIKQNAINECIEWQKTYDLGKKASSIQPKAKFLKDSILGMEGGFDATYEKNGDFGSSITSLAVFSDLKNSLEAHGGNFSENASEIFVGEKLKCKKSIAENALYDCCKKLDGLALKASLAKCSSEEVCLSKHRAEGKCHYVGNEKKNFGLDTVQYFCCFPSKLARVIHEEGRKQLGIKWGDGAEAKCRGLSLSEFQKIDFNQLDLSEVVEDYQVNQDELRHKIQKTIQDFETASPVDIQNNTNRTLKAQYEQIQSHQ